MTAFFDLKQGEYIPAPHARSPWSPDMLHGRLLGGLAARAIEADSEEGLVPARLTVDLFRNSPLLPLAVETVRVRDGRRIRVVDAVITTEQGQVARASGVFLRASEQPEGAHQDTPAWDETPPTADPEPSGDWEPPFHLWRLTDWRENRQRRAWMRERHPLVDDEPLSPFVRAALAADFASPMSNMSSTGLHFINADYTLTLSRLPEGDVLGMESTGHLSAGGVATGHCVLHDARGPVGFCLVTAVANAVPIGTR